MKLYDNDSCREEFAQAVYELLASDPDNFRANQIIAAFDAISPREAYPVEIPFEKLREMDQRSVYVVNWDDPSLNDWAVIRAETTSGHQLLRLSFLDRRKEQVNLTEDTYHNPWVPCYRKPAPAHRCVFVSGDRYRRLKADYEELKQEFDTLKANAGIAKHTVDI